MTETLRERIDMAVFGQVPEFVRVSVLLAGIDADGNRRRASSLLGSIARLPFAAEIEASQHMMAWRGAYTAVGLDESTVPPPEALAAWAATPGGVPSAGSLSDLVNGFSLRNAVPAAAYDVSAIMGDVWLCPSRGVETFIPPDGAEPECPPINELILVDDSTTVLARRWHGSQGRPTALSRSVTTVLVHLDFLPPLADHAESLCDSFTRLVTGFVGGSSDVQFLTREAPQSARSL